MSYQAEWKNGRETKAGERDCEGRYQAIRRELVGKVEHRPEPLTVLDVGAYQAYFSIRLAEEFGADCYAIDPYKGLPSGMLTFPNGGKVVPVRKKIEPADLGTLGFHDVGLLLSVLHHVPFWRELLITVVGRSKLAFIEIPDARERLPNAQCHDQTAEMHDLVRAVGGVTVAWTPGYDPTYDRPMYAVGTL